MRLLLKSLRPPLRLFPLLLEAHDDDEVVVVVGGGGVGGCCWRDVNCVLAGA